MSFTKSDVGFDSPYYNDFPAYGQLPPRPQQSFTNSYPRPHQSEALDSDYKAQPPAYEEATYTRVHPGAGVGTHPYAGLDHEDRTNRTAQSPSTHGQPLWQAQQRPQLSPSGLGQPRSSTKLGKPIAIPATIAEYGSPFLRGYPPCLASYGIGAETFLSFLDTLNRVAIKSPPLQVLGLAGNLIGFVPSGEAQIAGSVINLTASVATGVVQHGRTEIELRRANADLFAPRGLKVVIVQTAALVKLLGMPGALTADGKLDKKARLLTRLESTGGTELDGRLDISAQQRRLDALEPWIAELEVTPLPGIDAPDNALSRLNVKVSERNRAKGEKKLLEKRGKAHQEYRKGAQKAGEGFEREMGKIERGKGKELREIDEKLENAERKQKSRDVAKLEKEKAKLLAEYERDRSRVEKRYQKEMNEVEGGRMSDDEEEKSLRKLYWLVIREKDAPSGRGPNPDLPGSYVG
ncbi:hypothetical protein PV04_02853 [Phialophora macrospora]|uniref:Uncharacterized protein n=1 Tax=Phialophora macrospora TaxID=1851006 RepID=A0A0D2E8J1_9EURO|nr:hypothetical protein PV04_02853 [Phialophora macrospora]